MLMLIHTNEPRRDGPDPDEERRRRWEPISLRILLPVVASFGCLIVGGVTPPVVTYVLTVCAIALCLDAAVAAWPRQRRPMRSDGAGAPSGQDLFSEGSRGMRATSAKRAPSRLSTAPHSSSGSGANRSSTRARARIHPSSSSSDSSCPAPHPA